MAHKLLVKADILLEDKGFKSYLKYAEYPRGGSISVTLTFTNIGESDFPGGIINQVNLEHGGGISQSWRTVNASIPVLKTKEKFTFSGQSFPIELEGLYWLKCKVEASDKKPIEFFQFEGGDAHEEWMKPITVVNRENIEIIKLLEKLLEKIEHMSKKT